MSPYAQTLLAFVEAIEALGGKVEPAIEHDRPLSVVVPKQHEARATELIDKLQADLARLSPS